MDTNETPETDNQSFAKALGKEFVASAVITAGMLAGFIAVAVVTDKVRNRKAKKDATETPTES